MNIKRKHDSEMRIIVFGKWENIIKMQNKAYLIIYDYKSLLNAQHINEMRRFILRGIACMSYCVLKISPTVWEKIQ